MIRVCLLILAGGFAAQHSRVPISSDLCKLLIVALLLSLAWRWVRGPACLLLGFVLFMLAGQDVVSGRIESQYAGDSLLTQVRIVDFPRKSGRSVVMLVEPLNDHRLPRRSRVSWFEPAVLPSIGDVWQFELRLRRPRGSSNPGVFDAEAWLFRSKIHATGYVVNSHRNQKLGSGTESNIETFRRQFVARAVAVAETPRAAAGLAAIGVGARHLISPAQWHSFALSGTSHLMAISGLHVGLAATVAFFVTMAFLGVARTCRNAYIFSIAAGVLVAAVYTLVSGFGVPAQRAMLMLGIAAVAVVRRRAIDPYASIAAAATVIFVLNPIAAMTPGFSLSFAAVVVLLWFARCQKSRTRRDNFSNVVVRRVRQLFAMQLFLLFGLLPITVLVFQRIAFFATPVNFLGVPLFSVVTVPFTLAGLALSSVSDAMGNFALRIAASSIDWLGALIDQVVRLPLADISTIAIVGHDWLIVFLPALWVLLPKGFPGRWLGILAVVALLLNAPSPPAKGCIDAHVLDVGQGLGVVVQTRRKTLLFDTGASFRGGGSVAGQTIVPFFKSRGIRRIDWLLVSHADDDHSGGVGDIYQYAEIGRILSGEPLKNSGPPASDCKAGQGWRADDVSFQILHPNPGLPRRGNDSSCVLLVEVGEHSLLLTGDIEAVAERDLIEKTRLAPVDVVVIPHHGSLTSSSMPFVEAVSPTLAIVSAGHGNRWGFPKERVVSRWQSIGATVLATATAGAISVRLCADGGIQSVRKDRYERRRFWRRASS